MELADILLLVKAGYTREEIAQMDKQAPATADPEPVPAPVKTAEPEAKPADPQTPVAEPVAQPVPTAVPTQTETQPTMAEIMQSIAKLTSAVQANAIAQSVIPPGVTTPPKAEDMIAEIIRPTFKERG